MQTQLKAFPNLLKLNFRRKEENVAKFADKACASFFNEMKDTFEFNQKLSLKLRLVQIGSWRANFNLEKYKTCCRW